MVLRYHATVVAFAASLALVAGCNLAGPNRRYDAELAHYKELAQTVEHRELTTPPGEHAFTPAPRTIDVNAVPEEWWNLTLDEAIQMAVARSSVLRDLGGTVVRSPDSSRTILGPSQTASDPRFGMEAALSEFDATLATSVVAEKNDRMVNNFIAADTQERTLQQDLINFQTQVSKLSASGTRMTLRGVSIYDHNNASFNTFPSVWDSLVEAEIRVPLLQGAGTRFNRLAGPNAVPGFYNGVLIARVNTDISVAEFEIGLRDLVNDVENTYWDLYFAYRDLDARIAARNAALENWKRIKILLAQDQAGGLLEREAQAREQYFRYEEEVQNALSGRQQDIIALTTGTATGSYRGTGGVLVTERRLRLAIGLPITDGRMIRPADEPTFAQVRFDWTAASADAVSRRPELMRQRLEVKRREMELVAARNFLLPRLDFLGRYRYRGLGQDLIGDPDVVPPPLDPNGPFGRGSLDNLFSGDFQEWQLGAEITQPIGFRRGWAAVRNAQLNLAREKAVLEEQERQIIHDLSNAIGDLDRSYRLMETGYNRRLAAQQHVDILRFQMAQEQPVGPEQLLEAERRLAEADIQYHRALVEHMLAIKNVHFEKGTLLEYGHIFLTERLTVSPPPPPARTEPEPTPATGETLVAEATSHNTPAQPTPQAASPGAVPSAASPAPPVASAPSPGTGASPAPAPAAPSTSMPSSAPASGPMAPNAIPSAPPAPVAPRTGSPPPNSPKWYLLGAPPPQSGPLAMAAPQASPPSAIPPSGLPPVRSDLHELSRRDPTERSVLVPHDMPRQASSPAPGPTTAPAMPPPPAALAWATPSVPQATAPPPAMPQSAAPFPATTGASTPQAAAVPPAAVQPAAPVAAPRASTPPPASPPPPAPAPTTRAEALPQPTPPIERAAFAADAQSPHGDAGRVVWSWHRSPASAAPQGTMRLPPATMRLPPDDPATATYRLPPP